MALLWNLLICFTHSCFETMMMVTIMMVMMMMMTTLALIDETAYMYNVVM